MKGQKNAGIVVGVGLLVGVAAWVSTAPYLGNTGLSRTPGVIIGGDSDICTERLYDGWDETLMDR